MALKYATNCRHVIIGKPEEEYFMTAVNDMKLKKEEVFTEATNYSLGLSGFNLFKDLTSSFNQENYEFTNPQIIFARIILHSLNTISKLME